MTRAVRSAKSLLLSLLLSAGTLALGLGALELAVRLFLPTFHPDNAFHYIAEKANLPPLGVPGSTLTHRPKHGEFTVTVRFNGMGLRDAKPINAGTTALALGDSFTMGFGVEEHERFSNRVGDALGMHFHNTALPTDLAGYEKQLRYAETHADAIDTLILGLTVENDIAARPIGKKTEIPDITPADFEERFRLSSLSDVKYALSRNSALYIFTRYTLFNTDVTRAALGKAGFTQQAGSALHTLDPSPKVVAAATDYLDHLTKPYRRLVVVIPSRWLWTGGLQPEARATHNRVVAALTQRNIPHVDLRPVFEHTQAPLSYYFPIDGHWTPAGHQLAADAIVRHLKGR